jgi:hypothetical protein
MHATRSYVDLFGNVLVAILILTLYLLYSNKKELDRVALIIIFMSATGAANSKHLLAPVIGFILIFVIYQLFKVYYFQIKNPRQKRINLAKIILIGSFACLLIFGTQVKNTLLYQNPFYPVEISLMGHVLNHTEPQSNYMNPELRKLLPPVRWLKSALEIDALDKRRPTTWTLAMDFVPLDDAKYGVGGYFGGYFIVNVLLFIFLCWKYKSYETELLCILPALQIPAGALTIEIEFGFSNAAKDIDNPVKPFLDILQKRYRFDDKQIYELYIVKKIVSKGKEYIAFKINKYGN